MTHVKLKQILSYALKNNYILRNPAEDVDTPKRPQPSRNSLTQDELARFTRCLSRRALGGYSMTVWIALATGMRRSEILGLQWGCVNLNDSYVDVKQTLTEKGKIKDTTKTPSSLRRIPIDPDTVGRLKEWQVLQSEYFLSLGVAQSNKTPIISNKSCDFLDQHHFERWWRDFCVKYGFGEYRDNRGDLIPPPRYNEQGQQVDEQGRCYSRMNKKPKQPKRHYTGLHLHDARHTYATRLIANGIDYKTVQSLLGHANASTTLNLYAHAEEGQRRAASDLIGSLMNGTCDSNKVVNL
jgi:integrase